MNNLDSEKSPENSNIPRSLYNDEDPTFKIVLVGDGGTGKSSFIDRLNNGGYRKEYIATVGYEKHEILVETSLGSIKVIICDTSGQEKVGPLRDDYYEGINGAVLFFDLTSRITYKNVPEWHKDILRVSPDVPTALCANKADINLSLRKIKPKSISYHKNKTNIKLFEMSVKEKMGLKEPVEYILQSIKNDSSLKITGSIGSLFCDDFQSLSV